MKRWPEARAVSDPEMRLYGVFGLRRGTLGQVMGPATWRAGLSSIRHGFSRPVGDPLMLGGAFVVVGADVVAADLAEHSGAVPDLDRLSRAAVAART